MNKATCTMLNNDMNVQGSDTEINSAQAQEKPNSSKIVKYISFLFDYSSDLYRIFFTVVLPALKHEV